MATAIDDVRRILDQFQEDVSLEDVQHRIYVCPRAEREPSERRPDARAGEASGRVGSRGEERR